MLIDDDEVAELDNYRKSLDRDLANEFEFRDYWPVSTGQLNGDHNVLRFSPLVAMVQLDEPDFPILIRTRGLTLAAFCVPEAFVDLEWDIALAVTQEVEVRVNKPLSGFDKW